MTDLVKEALKRWAKETFLSQMVTASGGELVDEADEFLGLTVQSIENTRVMYDFYDSHKVYLCIDKSTFESRYTWKVCWSYTEFDGSSGGWSSRAEAEKVGFTKCAELLNEKLCKQK